MLTVTLKPDLAEQITHLAGSNNQARIDAFIDQALRAFLTPVPPKISREAKIRAESETFEQQHATLLANYANQYVALHHGQVIDHDPDLRTLHLRVFAQLGHTTVLLKKVTKEAEQRIKGRTTLFSDATC